MKHLFIIFSYVLLFIGCGQNSGTSPEAGPANADSSKAEKTETREERNKKIVQDLHAALNDHNIDRMLSFMSGDAEDLGDGTGNPVKGADSLKASMTMFLNAFPDLKADNLKFFADGNQVVVLGDYTGTFKNDMGKMKATGKSFKFSDADIFTLNDEGKVTSHRYIQPSSTLFNQVSEKKK